MVTGPGIPEDERGAVTKRFYRSDKSRCTEGLGLGLSLVAAIVNLHGFRLTIGGCPGATAETTATAASQIVGVLKAAGLVSIRIETLDLDPPVACVIGSVAAPI